MDDKNCRMCLFHNILYDSLGEDGCTCSHPINGLQSCCCGQDPPYCEQLNYHVIAQKKALMEYLENQRRKAIAETFSKAPSQRKFRKRK